MTRGTPPLSAFEATEEPVPWRKVGLFFASFFGGLLLLYVCVRVGGNFTQAFHTDMSVARADIVIGRALPVGTPAADVVKFFRRSSIITGGEVHTEGTPPNERRLIYGGVHPRWWNRRLMDRHLQIEIFVDESDRVIGSSVSQSYIFF